MSLAKQLFSSQSAAQTDVSISREVPERPQRPQTKKKHDKTMAPVPSTLTQDKALFRGWWAHTTPPKTLEEEQGRYSASPAFAERIHEATDLVETLVAGMTGPQIDLVNAEWRAQFKGENFFLLNDPATVRNMLETNPGFTYRPKLGLAAKLIALGAEYGPPTNMTPQEVDPIIDALPPIQAAILDKRRKNVSKKRTLEARDATDENLSNASSELSQLLTDVGHLTTVLNMSVTEVGDAIHKFGLQTTNLDAIKTGPMLFKAMAAESDEVKTNFLRYAVSMKWCDSPAARAAVARYGPRFAFRFYMG